MSMFMQRPNNAYASVSDFLSSDQGEIYFYLAVTHTATGWIARIQHRDESAVLTGLGALCEVSECGSMSDALATLELYFAENGEQLQDEWVEQYMSLTCRFADRMPRQKQREQQRYVHTTCRNCELDIEGSHSENNWRDRGNNSYCANGLPHKPVNG